MRVKWPKHLRRKQVKEWHSTRAGYLAPTLMAAVVRKPKTLKPHEVVAKLKARRAQKKVTDGEPRGDSEPNHLLRSAGA